MGRPRGSPCRPSRCASRPRSAMSGPGATGPPRGRARRALQNARVPSRRKTSAAVSSRARQANRGEATSPTPCGGGLGRGSRRPKSQAERPSIRKVGETPHPDLPPQGGKENALDLTALTRLGPLSFRLIRRVNDPGSRRTMGRAASLSTGFLDPVLRGMGLPGGCAAAAGRVGADSTFSTVCSEFCGRS